MKWIGNSTYVKFVNGALCKKDSLRQKQFNNHEDWKIKEPLMEVPVWTRWKKQKKKKYKLTKTSNKQNAQNPIWLFYFYLTIKRSLFAK